MAKKTTSVEDMYGGRHRPFGQVREGSHHRIEHSPSMTARDQRRNQDPEDFHDANPAYARGRMI